MIADNEGPLSPPAFRTNTHSHTHTHDTYAAVATKEILDVARVRAAAQIAKIDTASAHGRLSLDEQTKRREHDHWRARARRIVCRPRSLPSAAGTPTLACSWHRASMHVARPEAGERAGGRHAAETRAAPVRQLQWSAVVCSGIFFRVRVSRRLLTGRTGDRRTGDGQAESADAAPTSSMSSVGNTASGVVRVGSRPCV
jgi:hypothetical protein